MSGSEEAQTRRFEAVVLPQLPAAFNLARWICRHEADAADVVQEACMRALQYFAGYQGGDARAWLLQIVRHTAYSWLGRNRPAGQRPLREDEFDADVAEDARWSLVDVAADPLQQLASEAQSRALREALAHLPVDQREVLVLREFEDLSYRQIAAITGHPIGTVMSRLSRARDQLAARLRALAGESS